MSIARSTARPVARPVAYGPTSNKWGGGGGAAPTISFNATTNLFESTAAGQWYADGSPISGQTGTTLDPYDPLWYGAVITCNGSNSLEMWIPEDIAGWGSTYQAGMFLPKVSLVQSSGLVSEWDAADTGVAATQASGSLQPTYSATGFNGKPGLTMDNKYLETAIPDNPSARSVVFLQKLSSSAPQYQGAQVMWGGNSNGALFEARNESGFKLEWVKRNTATKQKSTSNVTMDAETVMSGRISSSAYDFRDKGVSIGSGASGITFTGTSTTRLFKDKGGADQCIGANGGGAFIDTYLTDTDMAKLEGALCWATGNAGLLDAAHAYYASPAFN